MELTTSPLSVSIILCTHNRAAALATTLDALGTLTVPSGWLVETIVVDNASTDTTALVVKQRQQPLARLNLRYMFEARKGKAHALNRGLAAAKSTVILFTDDDVEPARDWIERLAAPLFRGEADAVGGRVILGPELSRPWLTENFQRWLAWCEYPLAEPPELIGANMGLSRTVLKHVPGFDPELGPGAAGLGEDTLFGWRVVAAGLKLKFVPDAVAWIFHEPEVLS